MSAPSDLPALRVIATRLGPVAIRESGSGEPLLAIHGGMGGADQSWILAQSILADASARRVIAVARPGYPGTQAPGLTADQQADLYAALLDALGIGQVVVAAISAGGPSAIQFAAHPGTRCKGLILVSAASKMLQTPPAMVSRLKTMALMTRLPGMLSYLRRQVAANPARAAARSANPELVAALAHPQAGPLLRLFQQSIFTDFRARLPGTRNDIAQLAMLAPLALAEIACPVLVIHGEADAVVLPAHATNVAVAVRQAKTLFLPDGGHEAIFTHMDAIRAQVRDFLA